MDRYSLAPALIATVTLFTIAFLRRNVGEEAKKPSSDFNQSDEGVNGKKVDSNSMTPSETETIARSRLAENSAGQFRPVVQVNQVPPEIATTGLQPSIGDVNPIDDRSPPVCTIKAKDSVEFTKEMLEQHPPQRHPPPPTMIQLEKTKGLGLKASDSLEFLHNQQQSTSIESEGKESNPLRQETLRTSTASPATRSTNGGPRIVSLGPRPTSPSLSSFTPSMMGLDDRSRLARALKMISVLFNQAKLINSEERRILKSLVLDQDEELLGAFEEYDSLMDGDASAEEKQLGLIGLMNVLKRRVIRPSPLV